MGKIWAIGHVEKKKGAYRIREGRSEEADDTLTSRSSHFPKQTWSAIQDPTWQLIKLEGDDARMNRRKE